MRILFTSLIILLCSPVFSQNLVPDSSFESYTNCPNIQGQIQCVLSPNVFPPTLTDWFSPVCTSADYYHPCSSNPYVVVPNNFFGQLPAHSGDAFVGIASYVYMGTNNTPTTNYREYVECQLTQPLVAGQTYYISCWVKNFSREPLFVGANFMALNKLEARFSNTLLSSVTSPIMGGNTTTMQLPTQAFITDTSWVRIVGEYIATGGEEYLTIGMFTNTAPQMQHILPNPPANGPDICAYYLIDDVSLRTTPPVNCDTVVVVHDTTLCTTQPVALTPVAVSTTYIWNTGASTPELTVTTGGTYWRIATDGCNAHIDTFKVTLFNNTITRTHDSVICATTETVTLSSVTAANSYQWNTGANTQNISVNEAGTYFCIAVKNCILYTDTFHVTSFQTFSTISDTTACFPVTLTLSAEPGADNYLWNTGATTGTISVSEPGNYHSEAIKGCDLYITDISVTANPSIESINIGEDTLICKEETITIGREYPDVTYLWNTGASTALIAPARPGTYIVLVDDGCKVLRDSVTIDMVACKDCFFVPTAFTPNADGKNDDIGVVSKCPLSSFNMMIVNRFGEIVHESSDVTARWDGQHKGERCDLGTYYYMIQYTATGNGEDHLLKGDITLIY